MAKKDGTGNGLVVMGFLGVIAALVFVGVEIRQSRIVAIADRFTARTELAMEGMRDRLPPGPSAFEIRTKLIAGEKLSDEETRAYQIHSLIYLLFIENNHFQYEQGLLSEIQWQGALDGLKRTVNDPAVNWEAIRWLRLVSPTLIELGDELYEGDSSSK